MKCRRSYGNFNSCAAEIYFFIQRLHAQSKIILFYDSMISYETSKQQIHPGYLLASIKISKCYLYFYFVQIIISLSLLLSLILQLETAAILLQIAACLLLAADLILRASEGMGTFLKSRMNVIDVFVFAIILCMVILDILLPQMIHHNQEDVSLVLLTLRYSIQFWRVFELSRESKKQMQIQALEKIDFKIIKVQDSDHSIQ